MHYILEQLKGFLLVLSNSIPPGARAARLFKPLCPSLKMSFAQLWLKDGAEFESVAESAESYFESRGWRGGDASHAAAVARKHSHTRSLAFEILFSTARVRARAKLTPLVRLRTSLRLTRRRRRGGGSPPPRTPLWRSCAPSLLWINSLCSKELLAAEHSLFGRKLEESAIQQVESKSESKLKSNYASRFWLFKRLRASDSLLLGLAKLLVPWTENVTNGACQLWNIL